MRSNEEICEYMRFYVGYMMSDDERFYDVFSLQSLIIIHYFFEGNFFLQVLTLGSNNGCN